MKLYLAVTADRYELPVAVTETVSELSRVTGTRTDVIYRALRDDRHNTGRVRGVRFRMAEEEPCT